MEHKYAIGQNVSFTRNSVVFLNSTPIVALVVRDVRETPEPNTEVRPRPMDLSYIIENENGWIPNPIRKHQFGLEDTKKYLFVQEKELTAVE